MAKMNRRLITFCFVLIYCVKNTGVYYLLPVPQAKEATLRPIATKNSNPGTEDTGFKLAPLADDDDEPRRLDDDDIELAKALAGEGTEGPPKGRPAEGPETDIDRKRAARQAQKSAAEEGDEKTKARAKPEDQETPKAKTLAEESVEHLRSMGIEVSDSDAEAYIHETLLKGDKEIPATPFLGTEDNIISYVEAEEERRRAAEEKTRRIKGIIAEIREFAPRIRQEVDRLDEAPRLYKIISSLLKYMKDKNLGKQSVVGSWVSKVFHERNNVQLLKKRIYKILDFLDKTAKSAEDKIYMPEPIPFDSVAAEPEPSGIELPGGRAMSDTEKIRLAVTLAESKMKAFKKARFIASIDSREKHVSPAYIPRLRRDASRLIGHPAMVFNKVRFENLDILDIIQKRDVKDEFQDYIIIGVSGKGDFTIIPVRPPETGLDARIPLRKGYTGTIERLELIRDAGNITMKQKVALMQLIARSEISKPKGNPAQDDNLATLKLCEPESTTIHAIDAGA